MENTKWDRPGDIKICLVVNNIDFEYLPVVIHHISALENKNGNEQLQIVHDFNILYDM